MKKIIKLLDSVFKEIKQPLFLTLLEVVTLATVAWLIATFVPHSLTIIKDLGWLTWIVVISLYKIITYKYNDVEQQDNQIENPEQNEQREQRERIQVPMFDSQMVPQEIPAPIMPMNVKAAIYPPVPQTPNEEENDDGTATSIRQ